MSIHHTPGPWHVTLGDEETVFADHVVVADCTHSMGISLTTIANARLISSAPDLLKMLDTLISRYEGVIADVDYDAARDLIVEAAGVSDEHGCEAYVAGIEKPGQVKPLPSIADVKGIMAE